MLLYGVRRPVLLKVHSDASLAELPLPRRWKGDSTLEINVGREVVADGTT